MGFDINPDELASSYGGKTAPPKAVDIHARAPIVNVQGVLEEELTKTLARIASDTAKAASTTDANYRKELTERIERAQQDIPELKRGIARAAGTPVPADTASASAPVASAPAFAINPDALKTSYAGEDKSEKPFSDAQIAAGAGALGGAIYGARKSLATADNSLAARLMEKQHNLPAGSLAAFEGALTPGMPTPTEASLIAARTVASPTAVTAGPLSATRIEPTFERPLVAPSSAYMGAGEGPTQVYNYALSLGLSPTQAMQAVDNTKEEGGAHYIKSQARAGDLKAQRMFPAGITALPEAPSIVAPVPSGGGSRPETPSVWRRPRAIGPAPWTIGARPSRLGGTGGVTPGESPIPAAPATPVGSTQQQSPLEETAARIRAASARAQALQRGANIAVRGAFGAPLAAQAYGMATQEAPIDWTQDLSFIGNLLGTFGPLTSKIPGIATRIPVAGPLGAALSIPYAVKHRKELAAGMNMSDISPTAFMGMPGEMEPAFPEYTKGALP